MARAQAVLVGALLSFSVLSPDRAANPEPKGESSLGAGATMTQSAPIASADPYNSGYPIERSTCLAIRLGPSAAAECGNLRVIHELPSTRTFNKERTPVLIYNSEFAHPWPSFNLLVTMTAAMTRPDNVELKMRVGGVDKVTRLWSGTDWPAGQLVARRLTIAYDGINDTTGYYPVQVEVTNIYPGGVRYTAAPVTGKIFIINRRNSPFGAGWWLAGLDQLINLNATEKVRIAGDGSARFYLNWGGVLNKYWTPWYDRTDTLVYNPGTATWTQEIGEGVVQTYNSAGRLTSIRNRFGETTTFTYAGTKVDRMYVPAPSGDRYYQFAYLGFNGQLSSVTAPPIGTTPRVVTVTNSAGYISAITDPGSVAVNFAYHGAGASQYLMARRTDRRAVTDTFTFDAMQKVASSRIRMGGTSPDMVLALTAGESRGYTGAADTSKVYTLLDGPRSVADTTVLVQIRFGSPRRTVDPLASTTRIAYRECSPGDPIYCAWTVLRLQRPAGQVVRAEYDLRGNVTRVIDSIGVTPGVSDTTRFSWDGKFDQLTAIVPPLNDSMAFGVNATNGRREWQQDARGTSSRVTFTYSATYPGQLLSVVLPAVNGQTATYQYTHDASRQNLATVRTPNLRLTTLTTDPIGRVTQEESQVDLTNTVKIQNRLTYDLRDLIIAESTLTVNAAASETLFVRRGFDAEGQIDSLRRWSKPDSVNAGAATTRWRYDNAGRVVAEVAPNGPRDSTVYDEDGNAVQRITRRGKTLTMAYDAANQLVMRVTPEVWYTERFGQLPIFTQPLPRFPYFRQPKVGGGYEDSLRIWADTAMFTYDGDGRLLTANNRDARVKRTYFTNGLLKDDSLRIAIYDRVENPAPDPYLLHAYGLSFTYDRNGRRVTRTDPVGLGGGQQTWKYHSQLGALDSLFDRATTGGTVVKGKFVYDNRGRLTSRTVLGGNVAESWTYDHDDQVVGRFDHILTEDSDYDGRRKATSIDIVSTLPGITETVTNEYDVLGALRVATSAKGSGLTDTYATDAFGRITGYKSDAGDVHSAAHYQRASGPVTAITDNRLTDGTPPSDTLAEDLTFEYDGAENQHFSQQWVWKWNTSWANEDFHRPGSAWTWQAYGADEKLRVSQRTWYDATDRPRTMFLEHRYDALGRKVLTRTRADTLCIQVPLPFPDCLQTIERYVWDGDQILYELRANGSDTLHGSELETESEAGNFYGAIRYAHGLDMDRPILVWKNAVDPFVPHWNFRGVAVSGSYAATGGQLPNVTWPGRDRGAYYGPDTRVPPTIATDFLGSLTDAGGDASGLLYRRNRYFDPRSAQFTQEDPLGVLAGLNLHGFGDGDPVNFSDPFGLCPEFITGRPCPTALAIGIGFIPVLGDAIEIAGAIAQRDLLTGERLRGIAVGATIAGTLFGSGKLAREAVTRLVKDAADNPAGWKRIGAFTEPALNKKARGGTSLQTILENAAGERLIRHTVLDRHGRVIDDHFRPIYKPRDVDRPNEHP